MTFFFDNNLSPVLVQGLRAFGEDVQHLRDSFAAEAPDTEWIPEVARRGWVVVTRDKHIRTRPLELDALRSHGLRVFIFSQKRDPDRWGWVELVVRRWLELKRFTETNGRPFVALIPEHGRIQKVR
ncbi:MAG: DUF5615 family PIN-like protein [Chloroflexi bacterium]|nr:DUF5615 family PIN-like protein [Chloroflexota bacterium]